MDALARIRPEERLRSGFQFLIHSWTSLPRPTTLRPTDELVGEIPNQRSRVDPALLRRVPSELVVLIST